MVVLDERVYWLARAVAASVGGEGLHGFAFEEGGCGEHFARGRRESWGSGAVLRMRVHGGARVRDEAVGWHCVGGRLVVVVSVS